MGKLKKEIQGCFNLLSLLQLILQGRGVGHKPGVCGGLAEIKLFCRIIDRMQRPQQILAVDEADDVVGVDPGDRDPAVADTRDERFDLGDRCRPGNGDEPPRSAADEATNPTAQQATGAEPGDSPGLVPAHRPAGGNTVQFQAA